MNADAVYDYMLNGGTLWLKPKPPGGLFRSKRRPWRVTLTLRDGSVLHPQRSAVEAAVRRKLLVEIAWQGSMYEYRLPPGVKPYPDPPPAPPRSPEEEYFASFDDCDLRGFQVEGFATFNPMATFYLLLGPNKAVYVGGAAVCTRSEAIYGALNWYPRTIAEAWAQAPI